MSGKLVVKCGNFAVLVDLHVLPPGSSKDTSWFSDHEKEEVCALLKDTIDSRVKQHLESRRQQQGQVKLKEYTQASPLFLKGNNLRIAAYFIKRWVKLRCVVKHHFRELYVFPDRFVVCASQLDPGSTVCDAEPMKLAIKKEISSGTSEYFADRGESDASHTLATTLKRQNSLRNMVQKTKAPKDATSSDCINACPSVGQGRSDAEGKNTALSEPECINKKPSKHDTNTPHHNNGLEFPDPGVESGVIHRQPSHDGRQHKPRSAEWLQAQDPAEALSWICESALQEEKQPLQMSVTQQKRRRHSSEGKTAGSSKKLNLRDDTFIGHSDTGRDATEDVPLALRVLSYQKSTPSTIPMGKASLEVKNKGHTGRDKLSNVTSKINSEQGSESGKTDVNGPPKKSRLQRIKK